jgi:hypothetical protein
MAESHLAPIDESVKLPAAVAAAAKAAEAYYKPDDQPAEPPAETPVEASEPVAQEPPAKTEAPRADVAKDDPPSENWEHRYRSMEGRFRQQMDINANLGNQIQQLSSTITQLQAPRERSFAQPLITEEERKAYGDDLLDVVSRKAMEAVNPQIQRLRNENQDLRRRVQSNEARDIYSVLDEEIPDWKDVNVHPDFLQWLNLPDIYSGTVRAGMLKAAFEAGDAPRVLAFFRGFLSESPQHRGQTPQATPAAQAPKREAARDLREFAAPGKARPAPGPAPSAAEQPVYTTRDIDRFYDRVRQGAYAGRNEVKDAEEAKIFAAVREGRVRRVK